jgi:glycosyltransferase involved in cell wall biosynthesis
LYGKDHSLSWLPKEKEKAEQLFTEAWLHNIERKLSSIALDFLSVNYSVKMSYGSKIEDIYSHIDRIVFEKKIDVLYVNGFPLNRLLAYYSRAPKLLDICDSRALLKRREYMNAGIYKGISFFQYLRAKRIEALLLDSYEITTVVSQVDAAYILSNIPRARLHIIPNGVDCDFFRPLGNTDETYPSIIFYGNMDFPPNRDAALFLHTQIVPLLKRAVPNISVYIVGRNPGRELTVLNGKNNITVTGEVEDIRPYIMKATVVVVPMRIGSGIKNKVLEAMAMGKPVVSTPLGVECLIPEVQNNLLIGRKAYELSQKILYLLYSDAARKKLAELGRASVKTHYSWNKCAEEYEKDFENLVSSERKHRVFI